MKTLILAVMAAATGLGGNPAWAQTVAEFNPDTTDRLQALQPFIEEASDRFGVPENWIRAVIKAESGGRSFVNGEPITSPAGAVGPMQVMPKTYEELRLRYGLGPDAGDPEQNVLAGTAYLKELYDRFGNAGMFAAYNAGPMRYQTYLNGNLPLPDETRTYLAALENVAPGAPIEATLTSGTELFFSLSGQLSAGRTAQTAPNSRDLFIPLSSSEPRFSVETSVP